MAIKNASDLLVYKTVSSTTQITKISVLDVSPMTTLGSLFITNLTDSSGTKFPSTGTGNPALNDADNVISRIKSTLTSKGYSVSSTSAVVDGYKSFTATNGLAGDVLTLGFTDGATGIIATDGIIKSVTTEGEDVSVSPIGHSTSASISFSADLRDITTKDSLGWQDNLGGLKSFELSTDAFVDITTEDDNYDFYNQYISLKDRTQVEVRFAERVTGGNDRYWQGNAYVTSLSMDAGVEENATYSVSFTGTGVATTGED